MRRRDFLSCVAGSALLGATGCAQSDGGLDGSFEVTRSAAEWRDMLTAREFEVMRREATERAYSSPLDRVSAPGTYHCKGCDQALYASDTKFDSGTGWPSFYAALDNAVDTKPDPGLWVQRTEVHCDRCGSHLGHIFNDGPPPTGKRHCINGICMVFRPRDGGVPIIG